MRSGHRLAVTAYFLRQKSGVIAPPEQGIPPIQRPARLPILTPSIKGFNRPCG